MFLFTIDIESLYTNIPLNESLDIIKEILIHDSDKKIPKETLMILLKDQVFQNDFIFNHNRFIQRRGVAMGKIFSPAVANIFLNKWENNLLSSNTNRPLMWKRYIDDIFGIWVGTFEELEHFLTNANNFDQNI